MSPGSSIEPLGAASAEAYATRAGAYRMKGEYDRAIRDFDDAIRLKPD